MQNLITKEDLKLEKQKYNDIPVVYCKHCLSLRIMGVTSDENLNFCDSCGSTEIGKCSFEEWNNMYIKRYGHSYLEEY